MEWLIFSAVGLILLVGDLVIVDRNAHKPSLREALIRTAVYVAVAVAFGVWVGFERGQDAGAKFFTGYALEMSLSFDNVLVISMIFGALGIPAPYRSRVLFWGIIGAILLRGLFIGFGTLIVDNFKWLLVGFGIFLIFTGAKMLVPGAEEEEISVESSRTLRLLRRFVPVTNSLDGSRFFSAGAATPLFAALVLIEVTDLIFALDSIPATFAVTVDPFLVFTSNMFAIIGLRSLFFVLEAIVDRFRYLPMALSAALILIGGKAILEIVFGLHIEPLIGLLAVLGLLAAGMGASLIIKEKTND